MSELGLLATDTPEINANDLIMSKNMADALHKHYPAHLWAVRCDGTTGMADVYNLALSGKRGYRLKLKDFYSASSFEKNIVRAGGEILERYRLARGSLNINHYSTLKTDFSGNFIPDL